MLTLNISLSNTNNSRKKQMTERLECLHMRLSDKMRTSLKRLGWGDEAIEELLNDWNNENEKIKNEMENENERIEDVDKNQNDGFIECEERIQNDEERSNRNREDKTDIKSNEIALNSDDDMTDDELDEPLVYALCLMNSRPKRTKTQDKETQWKLGTTEGVIYIPGVGEAIFDKMNCRFDFN